ncbi:unnamed protein product [Adineta steineri]|uniref:NAD(P)(+)--arginine ADP-ribosyltransferase n=1 Tax=Adineta steineri TaxID=433720 RepID=A0A819Z3L2_9BILA|nr:unnamed protein product [Adineta steineri]
MKGQKLTAENLRSTYLKVPLLSITEAIQQVPNSWTHLSFCPISLPPYITLPSGWTTNDLAAIKVYTSPCRLYDALNEALRTEKINEIQPWFSYLKLFDTAINKIPPVKRRYCRGIRVAPDSSYKIGTVITWWGVSSVSTNRSVCKNFASLHSGGCCGSLYDIKSISARNITNYSLYPGEAESILLPGTKVKIIKIELDSMSRVYVIDVEAISPDSTDGTVTVKSTTTTTSTPPLDFTAVLPLSTATSNKR